MKIKKYLDIFVSLFKKRTLTKEAFNNDVRMKITLSIIMTLGSVLLTVFNAINFINGKTDSFMMWTTISLAVVFGICAILLAAFKLRRFTQILMALAVGVIFSIYAWYGENQGFAILWIVVVPLVCMLFFDFKLGFWLSVYFLVYLVVIFYILPAFGIMVGSKSAGFYNDEFRLRFPALYLISFVVSVFLSGQRIYYQSKAEQNSLYDSLTSLKNRRFYTDYINEQKEKLMDNSFTVVSCDLNNLKSLNDVYGHEYGDEAIIGGAKVLSDIFGKYTENIFRTGGDEYVLFFDDKDNIIDMLVKEIRTKSDTIKIKSQTLSLSVGYAKCQDSDTSIELLISIAERNMYADKEEFYKTFHGERRRENRLSEIIREEDKE